MRSPKMEILQRYKHYLPFISLGLIVAILSVVFLLKSPSLALYFLYVLVTILTLSNLYFFKALRETNIERRAAHKKTDSSQQQSIKPTYSTITFRDVAGIDDAKDELNEILDFLKNPKKYRALDISLPKGILLVGPPGVGKTMIARALAGEADVPFYYQSGASFVELYVGAGAKKVRELFTQAKSHLPAIIFIDEIDAVGKKRDGNSNDEREATLNQLLTEMDGFEDSSSLIVIAATNKIEVLDEALLRAGRFDKRVHLSLPTPKERKEILRIYLKRKRHQVDLDHIARITVGFSAAAIATLTNEAAMDALKHNMNQLRDENFIRVKDKVQLGKKRVPPLNDEEKEIHALYQGAKAVVAHIHAIDYEKVSLYSDRFKLLEESIESTQTIKSKITTLMAGLSACEDTYNQKFTNSREDLILLDELTQKLRDYRLLGGILISDKEIDATLEKLYIDATKLVKAHKKTISNVAELLFEKEQISKEELHALL